MRWKKREIRWKRGWFSGITKRIALASAHAPWKPDSLVNLNTFYSPNICQRYYYSRQKLFTGTNNADGVCHFLLHTALLSQWVVMFGLPMLTHTQESEMLNSTLWCPFRCFLAPSSHPVYSPTTSFTPTENKCVLSSSSVNDKKRNHESDFLETLNVCWSLNWRFTEYGRLASTWI